jgi:hypothetical protein
MKLLYLLFILCLLGCVNNNNAPEYPKPITTISGLAEGDTIDTDIVSFQWSAIGGVSYSFSLDGIWTEWTSNTSITIDSLDEGKHTFSVKAKNDKVEETEYPSVNFHINSIRGPAIFTNQRIINTQRGLEFTLKISGDEFTAEGVRILVSYNPSAISILEINKGSFVNEKLIFLSDNSNGTSEINIVSFENEIRCRDNAELIEIKVKALQKGQFNIIVSGELRNSNNSEITLKTIRGSTVVSN